MLPWPPNLLLLPLLLLLHLRLLLCVSPQREWLERQRVAQPGAAAWPEHIFENFFIVVRSRGQRLAEWIQQQQQQLQRLQQQP